MTTDVFITARIDWDAHTIVVCDDQGFIRLPYTGALGPIDAVTYGARYLCQRRGYSDPVRDGEHRHGDGAVFTATTR